MIYLSFSCYLFIVWGPRAAIILHLRYFQQGSCKKGDQCTFFHEGADGLASHSPSKGSSFAKGGGGAGDRSALNSSFDSVLEAAKEVMTARFGTVEPKKEVHSEPL